MKPLLAILLLCSACYAQKPPKTVGVPAIHPRVENPPPDRSRDLGVLQLGAYQPRQLTDKEYKEQKKRYAEWLVHQRAASRAGISGKGGKRRRTEGISVHDDYQNAAMEAVRQVQGR